MCHGSYVSAPSFSMCRLELFSAANISPQHAAKPSDACRGLARRGVLLYGVGRKWQPRHMVLQRPLTRPPTMLFLLLIFFEVAAAVLQLDFELSPDEHNPPPGFNYLAKRDDYLNETLDFYAKGQLIVNYSLGLDNQELRTFIDIDSSDLWVIAPENPYCSSSSNAYTNASTSFCETNSTFNASLLTSFQSSNRSFHMTYGDYGQAWGRYVLDSITIGNVTVSNFTFGYAPEANTSSRTFGIGFPTGEYMYKTTKEVYDNFPMKLKSEGIIERAAYLIWIQNTSNSGAILFGAVDKSLFVTLGQVPAVQFNPNWASNNISRPAVMVTGIAIGNYLVLNETITARLAITRRSLVFPTQVVQNIARYLNFTYLGTWYQGPCPSIPHGTSLDFVLDGFTLYLNIKQFVNFYYRYDNGTELCTLSIYPTELLYEVVFGLDFFMGVYTVVDIENKCILLGRLTIPINEPEVVKITGKGRDIPGAINYYNTPITVLSTIADVFLSTPEPSTSQAEILTGSPSVGTSTGSPDAGLLAPRTSENAPTYATSTGRPDAEHPTIRYTQLITETGIVDFPLTASGGGEYTVTTRITVTGGGATMHVLSMLLLLFVFAVLI